MSYCRFSSNGFQCDLYAYADTSGCWIIHVASKRHKQPGPLLEDHLRLMDAGHGTGEVIWDNATLKDYERAVKKWQRKQKKKGAKALLTIGLPCDGETYHIGTLGAFYDKVKELIDMGYVCDPGVLTLIQEDIDKYGREFMLTADPGVPMDARYKEGTIRCAIH